MPSSNLNSLILSVLKPMNPQMNKKKFFFLKKIAWNAKTMCINACIGMYQKSIDFYIWLFSQKKLTYKIRISMSDRKSCVLFNQIQIVEKKERSRQFATDFIHIAVTWAGLVHTAHCTFVHVMASNLLY